MKLSAALAMIVVAGLGGTALAQPVVSIPLTGGTQGPYGPVGDTFSTPGSSLQWFTFTLSAPTTVDIDFNRTSAPPDLIATLYSGDANGFDASAAGFHIDYLDNGVGPLGFVNRQDDTEDDGFGGPFGDPRFVLDLTPGTYSLVISSLQGAGAEYTVTTNVPAPASAGLLAIGGIAALRRRRR